MFFLKMHTYFCFSFIAPENFSFRFACTLEWWWMSWLCRPGADGDGPSDPHWTSSAAKAMREVNWKCGGGTQEQTRKKTRRNESKGMTTCWVVLWLLAELWLIESGMLLFLLLLFIHVPIADSCIIHAHKQQVTAKRNGGKKKQQETITDSVSFGSRENWM